MFEQSVSVIIPTFNRAHLIERAIKSVLAQTFTSLEVIVVDDCSNDNTSEVVNNIDDERVKYIKLDLNSGANVARNVGVKHAKYNLIAFQDSDDIWHRNKLEIQIDFLIRNNFDVVASKYNKFVNDKFNAVSPQMQVDSESLMTIELTQNVISTQTIFGKKECFLNEHFDIEFPRLQDWELAIRLVHKYRFGYINEPLVDVFLQADSISSNPEKLLNAYVMLISKHQQRYLHKPSEYESINIDACKAAIHANKPGRFFLYAAYKNNRSIKIIIYLFLDYVRMIGPLITLKKNLMKLKSGIINAQSGIPKNNAR